MLFDPRAHEAVLDAEWNPADAEAAIREIARDAEDALSERDWWPVHPLDVEDGDPEVWHGVYMGAAGVVWALEQLARAGLHEPRLDHAALAHAILESYRRRPEFEGPSVWIAEGGIALVAWLLAPTPELEARLHELVAVPEQDTLELMWGSPGLLLIADVLDDAPAWNALAAHLMRRWENGLWTQDLYGSKAQILGPAHGMTGVVAALASRLDPIDALVAGTTNAIAATAVQEGALANWPPATEDTLVHRLGFIRTQWCHGAPGVVTSLAGLPREDTLDALLLAGGELTWTAGPLRKGANLCHGTAGNGFAFLKLFARTQDELWLARARRFAVHAAAQVAAGDRGRYSLWTGDLGTAIYLQQCLAGTADVPTIDRW